MTSQPITSDSLASYAAGLIIPVVDTTAGAGLKNKKITAAALLAGASSPSVPGAGYVTSNGTMLTAVTTIPYSGLPAEVQNMPVAVPYQGKPQAAQRTIVSVGQSCTLPANFAGTVQNFVTPSTGTAAWVLSRLHAGIISAAGTLTINSSGTLTLPTVGAVAFAAGEALVVDAPGAQDATLADGCLTIMLLKG